MVLAPVHLPSARRFALPAVALGLLSVVALAAAEEPPRRLALADALARAEQRGFDALAAEAVVRSAEADRETAGRFPNPAITGAWLRSTSVPVPGGTTSSSGYTVAGSDQGAVEGLAAGKRALRIGRADAAVSSARFGRDDALRVLRRETSRAYYDVLLAEASERVRAKFGFSCSSAASQLEEIEEFTRAYPGEQTVRIVSI